MTPGQTAQRVFPAIWLVCYRVTYDQVADENLKDFGFQTLTAREHLLQDLDQEMPKGRADESAVGSHLGDSGTEVMTVLARILCDPRSEDFLERSQRSRREHLGPQRIALQLLQVGLKAVVSRGAQSTYKRTGNIQPDSPASS